MLLDICFGSKSAWRVLLLYGESPGAGFTRQELKEHTKLGNKALSFALKRLSAFGILTKSKKQLGLAVYKLNRESKYIDDIINLLKKERQDLNHLPYNFSSIAREFSREVLDSADVIEAYLFGSVAKGTYREDSDIDFAVVAEQKTPPKDMAVNSLCNRLSTKFNRKVQCFILTKEQISRKKHGLAKEILKHGIKLF